MSDGSGLVQFMTAVSEIARGATRPSLLPVWDRHLLSARHPPRVTHTHLEYAKIPDDFFPPLSALAQRSFFFRRDELSALRRLIQPHLRHLCSTLDVLTALLWKCRTIALSPDPEEEVRVMSLVNARGRFTNPPLPAGYYGNAIVYPAAVTKAGRLRERGLEYAVEMVRRAKEEATVEYVRSVADLMAARERRPVFPLRGSLVVSDVTKAGIGEVDYGWGKAAYGGVARAGTGDVGVVSFYGRFKNGKGEEGVAVALCLPQEAMVRFEKEIIRHGIAGLADHRHLNVKPRIVSSL